MTKPEKKKELNGLRCLMCESPLKGAQQKYCGAKCRRRANKAPTYEHEGRPTIMSEAVIKKLEEAFLVGASDLEACFYANISHQTLYNYQNANPEFVERKRLLKQKPVLLARQTVVQKISTDGKLALKFLERKRRKEFAIRHELTGKDGSKLYDDHDEAKLADIIARAAKRSSSNSDKGSKKKSS